MKNRSTFYSSLTLVAFAYATPLRAQTAPATEPTPEPNAPPSSEPTPSEPKDAAPSSPDEAAPNAEPETPPSAEPSPTASGAEVAPEAVAVTATGEGEATTAAPVAEEPPSELEAVVVQAKALSTSDTAASELAEVPGGTNLIKGSDLNKGSVGTIADALRNQPGVYAESVNGGEATRLSIRGSGIIRGGFLFGWGNVLQLDGQRLYGASGNPYEAIEPLAVDHIEILRGVNAFENGPLSLGGSINYVTKTGYDTTPFYARFEAGAYDYFHEQVSSGLVVGPFDYYASVSRFDKGGFRDNTRSHSTRIVSNFGYQFSKNVKTRVHFRFAEQYQEDAGFLTQAQLQDNPRQSQFGADVRERVNPGTFVLGNSWNAQLDARSSLEAGAQFDSSPINGTAKSGPAATYFIFQQLAGSVKYRRSDDLFGQESNTLVSFIGHGTTDNSWKAVNNTTGQVSAFRPASQSDWTLLATNDTNLVGGLWLDLGLAGIYQQRYTSVTEGQNLVGDSIWKDYFNVAPKAALRYYITPDAQVYANVSRAIDTPSANSFIRTDAFYVPQEFLSLRETKATSLEFGSKGQGGPNNIFQWNLSYYYSWIEDELLTVQVAPMVTAASNATPTYHQGVEAGLDVRLWEHASNDDGTSAQRQQVVLRQSYTWNDFHFVDDPTFGTNQLAGVPLHIYRAELAYEHPWGFYIGTNVTASLAEFPVDFGNTIYNPTYTLWGAKIGYSAPKSGLEIFVEARNLLDAKYSAVVSPIYNAAGADSAVYSPGEGRVVNGGIAWRY
jgi:iron complex outermembrane recepter protein